MIDQIEFEDVFVEMISLNYSEEILSIRSHLSSDQGISYEVFDFDFLDVKFEEQTETSLPLSNGLSFDYLKKENCEDGKFFIDLMISSHLQPNCIFQISFFCDSISKKLIRRYE